MDNEPYEPFYQKTYKNNFNKIKDTNYIILLSNYNYTEYEFGYIGKFNKLLFNKYEGRLIFKIDKCISNNYNVNLIRIEIPFNAFYDELALNSDNLLNLVNTKKYILDNAPNKIILKMNYTFDEELAKEIDVEDKFLIIYDLNDKNLELAKKLINKKLDNIKKKYNDLTDEQKSEFLKWCNK
jgi:hypothetical protein